MAARSHDVSLPCNAKLGSGADPLNWVKTARAMECSHLDEVVRMVDAYASATQVVIEGANLSVPQVAAIARRPEVQVVLDAASAKPRVDESSNWVLNKIMNGGDIYGVTTGFGAWRGESLRALVC